VIQGQLIIRNEHGQENEDDGVDQVHFVYEYDCRQLSPDINWLMAAHRLLRILNHVEKEDAARSGCWGECSVWVSARSKTDLGYNSEMVPTNRECRYSR